MKSNILLMGEIGTGKTRSLLTLLPEFLDPHTGNVERGAGLETFLIALEPGYEAVFGSNSCAQGLHAHYVRQAAPDWKTMRKYASLAATMSMDALVKLADPGKSRYTQFMEVFAICESFVCDSCSRDFGDVSDWDNTRAICLDSLTGISSVAMSAVVGGKPIKSLPEYGFAMDFIEGFFKLFWGATQCNAICLAHIDREVNPVSGLSGITAHTLGQKLAPKLVKIPDEVILAEHDKGRYTWSTIADGVILKRRRLPESASLQPTFAQLFR